MIIISFIIIIIIIVLPSLQDGATVFQVSPAPIPTHLCVSGRVCDSPACGNKGEVCSCVGGEVARAVQWTGT